MTQPFYIVIPARYGSTRLPGKPLRDIAGKPMIQRVYEQSLKAGAEKVIVATDDERIKDCVTGFGGDVCLTAPDHPSGTDRLEEVSRLSGFTDEDIIVNVQGDEPMIPPAVITQVADNLAANSQVAVATLSEPIKEAADFKNPNVVKVVTDTANLALYFSRAPIPWPRDHFQSGSTGLPDNLEARRHLGIYAYRVRQLREFVSWPVSPIEQIECLEQLRFMWNGERIHVEESCEAVPGGVDTEEDLLRISARFK